MRLKSFEFAELTLKIGERYAIEIDNNALIHVSTFGDWIDLVK